MRPTPATATAPNSTAISASALTKHYAGTNRHDAVDALGPIDITVAPGEFVAVIGPSGCGKSTLLRLLAGLERPTAGTIEAGGRPTDGPDRSRAMVFQQPALFPWLSVAENIGFGLQGRTRRERAARVADLVAMVGLHGFESHFPATLSGGMQQRVALARAIAPDPTLLLLDEPFGALDQQTRASMQEMLPTLWAGEYKTALLVTHDIEEALFLADRIVVMTARPGRVCDTIAVPFPRPRHYTVRTDPAFVSLKARITELLRQDR